ncbi:class C sortase [Eggerthella timonensis]|uniref:class C sortase n=1 Tax=Eggerthella timonensis TaxID=1871008 RepID=UPI000C774284|nr:class C sortase [Eggerthella timonensis]
MDSRTRKAAGRRPSPRPPRKASIALAALLIAAGAGAIGYPFAMQALYRADAEQAVGRYDVEYGGAAAAGKSASGKDLDRLLADLEAYNGRIFEEGQAGLKDPFSYEQPAVDLAAYGFDEDMIGYLEVPKMGLRVPVYLGASEENMARGAALLGETSAPIGGESTNAVIAGHRGMATAAMFRDIESLEVGDEVEVANPFGKLEYRVSEIRVIDPGDREAVLIQPGRDLVTLLTCHPFPTNAQRYLVYCERRR